MRLIRTALVEYTAHRPSTFRLSGFSRMLSSQIAKGVSRLAQFGHTAIRLPLEKLDDEFDLPLRRTEQVSQAFGSGRGMLWRQQIAA
jgi:hypothetical protein